MVVGLAETAGWVVCVCLIGLNKRTCAGDGTDVIELGFLFGYVGTVVAETI